MLAAKERVLRCQQGLDLANGHFTFKPTIPQTPGFHEEAALQEKLKEAGDQYKDRCKELILEHCTTLLNNNEQILQELERENPPAATSPSPEAIMARVAEMMEGIETRIMGALPATIAHVMGAASTAETAETE